MAQFIKTIQNFAFQNALWEKNSKLIVGVSGGPDSVCLLDVFVKLTKKYNLKLHIVHVNYELRGEDSKKDEIFVRELAKKYNIEVTVLKPKKRTYKGNLENCLRNIRYDFFEKVRSELDYDLIAVAHNQDDQAETVLMRIIRGSGLAGLGGIRIKTRNIIRPLLQTSKTDILAYLKANNLKYRIDKSNFEKKFTRNSIRHGLLPYIEKSFNPEIKTTLAEWSKSVADDYEFIEKSSRHFKSFVCENGRSKFSADEFEKLPFSMQRQILRNIFIDLKGATTDIESSQIEELAKVVKSKKSKSQKASIGGLNISKKGDKVYIRC